MFLFLATGNFGYFAQSKRRQYAISAPRGNTERSGVVYIVEYSDGNENLGFIQKLTPTGIFDHLYILLLLQEMHEKCRCIRKCLHSMITL